MDLETLILKEKEELEKKVGELQKKNQQLLKENREIKHLLKENREIKKVILELKDELSTLLDSPNYQATVQEVSGEKAVISIEGKCVEVGIHKGVGTIEVGDSVFVNAGMNCIVKKKGKGYLLGEIGVIKEVLDMERAVVEIGSQQYVLLKASEIESLEVGDFVRVSLDDQMIFGVVERKMEEFLLNEERIPDIRFRDVGGLENEINLLKEKIILPLLHQELAKKYESPLLPSLLPVGILLHGPSGCGKTHLARALVGEISDIAKDNVSFYEIEAPKFLSHLVGKTEEAIREIFNVQGDRKKYKIIIIDEIESILKIRGTGISSDIEKTIVPQFNVMLDGFRRGKGIITVGLTNRLDLIDPSILRPGRLNPQIKIRRPNRKGVEEIFKIYLQPLLKTNERVEELIESVVSYIFAPNSPMSEMAEILYVDGKRERIGARAVITGSHITSIIDRARQRAFVREIKKGKKDGIDLEDLIVSTKLIITEEFKKLKPNNIKEYIEDLQHTRVDSVILLNKN
jgi:proteasome-associated ATPase